MIAVGSQFGAYRILDKLGEGGMGVVYRALDTELQRQVAIKTLLAAPDPDSQSRFLREAKAASRLQHPTVVTIHHIGVEGGIPYIVMELVEGQTLKKALGGRAMNLRQACDIAMQVCEGLSAAHEMAVVHRDIKAENIIITPRGAVKILDFGLAKLTDAPSGDGMTMAQTQAGMVMGTVSHMSPEQALGREVDHRSDIFSFGVMLYEMLTGRTPFAAQTSQAILARVLNHDPEPVTQSNPTVPPELEQVVVECLQKDRALRPSSAEVLSMLTSVRATMSGKPATSGQGTSPVVVAPRGGISKLQSGGTPSVRSGLGTAASAGTAAFAPQSGARPGPAEAGAAASTTTVTPAMRATYWALRSLRLLVAVGSAIVPLAFVLHFLIGGGVIRPEIVEGTLVMSVMSAIVTPVLVLAGKVLQFRTVVDGWNLLEPVAAIAALVLRRLVVLPFVKMEEWARRRVTVATRVESRGPSLAGARVGDQRMAMLREYAETKKLLFQQKRRLAFLSADVVNVARLKVGEDKLVIEHAMAEYRKYVERALGLNHAWKTTWQGETVLCAFHNIDAAVRAGQQIVGELGWFNDGVHQARHRFEVRCGVSAGEIVFPEDKRIEDLSDETLDLAVALRNRAAEGTLLVSSETLAEVADATGFSPLAEAFAGLPVSEWRPRASDRSAPPVQDATSDPVFDRTIAPAGRPEDVDLTVPPASRSGR